jgi:hypothetical protein
MKRGLILKFFGVRFCLPLLQNLVFRQFLQLFWYFILPLAFAIWYLRSVSANLFCVLE